MSNLRQAAQQALEALNRSDYLGWQLNIPIIKALKAALADGDEMTCPHCEYNKQRAQLWRHEAYKHAGHPLDWEPELMVRPKPLTDEEVETAYKHIWRDLPDDFDHTTYAWIEQGIRYAEQAHGIKP